MSERILITGSAGYIGNAVVHQPEHHGITNYLALDCGNRDSWVKQVGGSSLTDYPKYNYLFCDLTQSGPVLNILNYYKPTIILHLASQPSGPFSEISSLHRIQTQTMNLTMLLNLLCGVKDLGLDSKFIVTTTTGVPGAPNGPIEETHAPNLAGSAYHASRGFDSANLALAAKQWKAKILELRTSIVYGTRTHEATAPVTRFDYDFYFGTAVHRFILRKKLGQSLTIYGKGEQKKPIISLKDCVKGILHAINSDIKPGHEIMNQTTECISVLDMARAVGGSIEHIPNPRVEKEDHQMLIHNDKYLKLLNSEPVKLKDETQTIYQDINLTHLDIGIWKEVYEGRLPQRGA